MASETTQESTVIFPTKIFAVHTAEQFLRLYHSSLKGDVINVFVDESIYEQQLAALAGVPGFDSNKNHLQIAPRTLISLHILCVNFLSSSDKEALEIIRKKDLAKEAIAYLSESQLIEKIRERQSRRHAMTQDTYDPLFGGEIIIDNQSVVNNL